MAAQARPSSWLTCRNVCEWHDWLVQNHAQAGQPVVPAQSEPGRNTYRRGPDDGSGYGDHPCGTGERSVASRILLPESPRHSSRTCGCAGGRPGGRGRIRPLVKQQKITGYRLDRAKPNTGDPPEPDRQGSQERPRGDRMMTDIRYPPGNIMQCNDWHLDL